jgi:hypothetical protein
MHSMHTTTRAGKHLSWLPQLKEASYEEHSDIRHFPLRMGLLPSGGCANPGWRTQKTGCRRRTRTNTAERDRLLWF